ncbi:hypothetical protein MKW98_010555 [Papaver atlanticum]|uniref:Uncharacterized protein n=1 Tax=Papaver atlanticum TaxID=357466 RepID=A0AAD4S2Z3_9MAGN|nr:hypothetical protein MKW98_010555 [Papaver atlanticum]
MPKEYGRDSSSIYTPLHLRYNKVLTGESICWRRISSGFWVVSKQLIPPCSRFNTSEPVNDPPFIHVPETIIISGNISTHSSRNFDEKRGKFEILVGDPNVLCFHGLIDFGVMKQQQKNMIEEIYANFEASQAAICGRALPERH